MNTVLAGFTALGVLLVPLLDARVDLETILFGDLLAANTTDLLRTALSASSLIAMLVWSYRDLVFVGIDPEGAAIAKRPVLLIRLIPHHLEQVLASWWINRAAGFIQQQDLGLLHQRSGQQDALLLTAGELA